MYVYKHFKNVHTRVRWDGDLGTVRPLMNLQAWAIQAGRKFSLTLSYMPPSNGGGKLLGTNLLSSILGAMPASVFIGSSVQ